MMSTRLTLTRVVAATLALSSAAVASAQIPNPKPAIDAAKNARTATENAQKKNSEALDPQPPAAQAPARPGEPAKPAEQPPAQQQPTGSTLPPGAAPGTSSSGYSYDPAGRRDPFISLLGRGGDVPAQGVRPQGLPGLLIAEVTVKGVLRTAKGDYVALLQAPDNKTFIAHGGDKVLDGAVKAITATEVVFTQDVTDPLSLVKQREVRKAIRPEAR
jgi:type IV pilus assembly protein PilP